MRAHKLMVHSEEGHLAGLVEQVGEGDEGLGLLQVQNEDGGDERHALDLQQETRTNQQWAIFHTLLNSVDEVTKVTGPP